MDPSPADESVVPRPPPPPAAKRKTSLRQYLLFGVGGLIGGVLGALGAHFGLDLLVPLSSKPLKFVSLALLPVAWLLAVGFHELGHLVGGWITGGRFLLFTVGPIMLRRTPNGVRFVLNRSFNLAGGAAACLPLDPAKTTPRRTAIMIITGPVFSLVLVVPALWLAYALVSTPAPLSDGRAIGQHFALFTAGLSALIFLVTIFPATGGGFHTDGKRTLRLLRNDAAAAQEAALVALTVAGLAGIRPADYPPETVRRAVSLNDGSLFDLYGHLTVYYHAADRKDWPAAQRHLDHALTGADQLVPYVRATLFCEYAWLLATRTNDAASARAWLEAAPRADFDPATPLRAEAAVLLAEARKGEAAAKARDALHALEHKSLSPVKSRFAADAIADVIRRAAA